MKKCTVLLYKMKKKPENILENWWWCGDQPHIMCDHRARQAVGQQTKLYECERVACQSGTPTLQQKYSPQHVELLEWTLLFKTHTGRKKMVDHLNLKLSKIIWN